MATASNKKSSRRRSTFGVRESLKNQNNQTSTNTRKSLHTSATDRVMYRCHNANYLEEATKFDESFLMLITRNTWSVHRMCHFPQIDYQAAKLKYYASKIRQELVNQLLNENPDTVFTVKTFQVPIFQDSDNGGLQIEVHMAKNSAKPQLKYTGLIFSVDEEHPTDINSEIKPILLSTGLANISRVVVKAIKAMFDLVINPLGLSEDDVMWLAAMLSDSEENESNKVQYNFNYIKIAMTNSITVSIPGKLLKKLWNIIHPEDAEEITYNQVHAFHKQIQCQLTMLYGINFEMLTLKKICFQDSEINSDGKIKMKTKQSIFKILYFVSDISTLL